MKSLCDCPKVDVKYGHFLSPNAFVSFVRKSLDITVLPGYRSADDLRTNIEAAQNTCAIVFF